jgi:hypothetical protein
MLSIWVLHKVYKFYRHGGLALEMVWLFVCVHFSPYLIPLRFFYD